LFFVDDKVIIFNTEDNLHKLNQIITEYDLTLCVQKTKLVAFKGRVPVIRKIVRDNKIIGQENSFYYLGNLISYENKKWTLITNWITVLLL